MYKKSIVHYMTKVCVDILLCVSIICSVYVPFSKAVIIKYFGFAEKTAGPMVIILLLSGILSAYILWQIHVMFKTLLVGTPFIESNVTCFRKIAVASLLISIIYSFKCLFAFTLGTVVIVLIFMIACLFALTLKDLFKQAIHYKDENDLTV